jgi:patatin-related protein
LTIGNRCRRIDGMGGKAATPYEATQEIRYAVVMYGGVSLAIYINGVVQELLHLVRATAPAQPPTLTEVPSEALVPDDELTGSEAVYRKLGQMLEYRRRDDLESPRSAPPADGDPIKTRFIVDIISGSSAGGINGIFLAKALANDTPLEQLKTLWYDEGDMAKLIGDAESYVGTSLQRKPPDSLLNSRRMYEKLLVAFDGMDEAAASGAGENADRSRLVDELDLWITATDLRGLALPIDLYDRVVFEPRFKNVFHFGYSNPFADDEDVFNDLVSDNNPMLAFAARATSSFPFAFDPMQLVAIDDSAPSNNGTAASVSPAWKKFFREYTAAGGTGENQDAYRFQAFGDGGYLDNKPFTWSTSTLDRRRAELPVDRKLLYVEPDPGLSDVLDKRPDEPYPIARPVDEQIELKAKPDPLANVRAAILELPRKENIRDDLEELLKRNRRVDRIEWAARAVDRTIATQDWRPLDREQWLELSSARAAREHYGLQYAAYYRLKIAGVLDDLAELATRLAGFDTESDERSAIRCFIEAWFREQYENDQERNEFLIQFDLSYRLRRLDFVLERINEQLLENPEAAPGLRALRRQLMAIFLQLRARGREMRARSVDNPLAAGITQIPIARPDLLRILSGSRNQEEAVANAQAFLASNVPFAVALTNFSNAVRAALEPVLGPDDVGGRAAIATAANDGVAAELVTPLLGYYDRFVLYDSVLLPLNYGAVGESDRVEVIRVSPEDATSLVDEIAEKKRKLGGIEVNHFGGFFRLDWRQNDMLWGRLDAAERVITTLLPTDEFDRQLVAALVRDAHRAIIAEEIDIDHGDVAASDEALETLRTAAIDRTLRGPEVAGLLGRGAQVSADVLGTVQSALAVKVLLGFLRGMLVLIGSALRPTRWVLIGLGLAGVAIAAAIAIAEAWSVHWLGRLGWVLAALWVVVVALGAVLFIGGRTVQLAPKKPPPSQARKLATWVLLALAAVGVAALAAIFLGALLDGVHTSKLLSWLPGW